LYRYNEAVVASLLKRSKGALQLVDVSGELTHLQRRPGMYTWHVGDVFGGAVQVLNSVYPKLETAWFQALKLKCEKLVSEFVENGFKCCFQIQRVPLQCGWHERPGAGGRQQRNLADTMWPPSVGALYKLQSVDP
jgi:hypothetical protein